MNISKEEIVETLRKDSRLIVRELGLLGDEYNKTGVTAVERHLLIELESLVFPDVSEIANILLLDKSTASRLVAKLVKKGLVNYTADDQDKRRRHLQLTKKGHSQLESIKKMAQKQVHEALAILSEDEAIAVMRGLNLYAKGLKKARLKKEFQIEDLEPQDDVALSQMILSVLEEYNCNKPGFAAQDSELQAMYETYTKRGFAYFVIKRGLKIVGGAGIAPLEGGKKETCELRKMYLAPEARGVGLGNVLMEACLKAAKQKGYQCCYLETTKLMTHARELYLKHGFKEIKRQGSTGHFGCDCFFEKKL